MVYTLKWKGPLYVGNFPDEEKKIAWENLEGPGVYLMFQDYQENSAKGETFYTVYAGKSMNLRNRLHEHLASFLGFQYWLRKQYPSLRSLNDIRKNSNDWTDEYIFKKTEINGLACYNDLLTWLPRSIREIKKIHFYYCPYTGEDHKEFCKWVEGFLVYYLKTHQWDRELFSEQKGKKSKPWFCDNVNHPVSEKRLTSNECPPEFRDVSLASKNCPEFIQKVFFGKNESRKSKT